MTDLYPRCIVCGAPVKDGRCYGLRTGYMHEECASPPAESDDE